MYVVKTNRLGLYTSGYAGLYASEIEALNQACSFLAAGDELTSIEVLNGSERIDGKDLAACCRGEKNLTTDLKATPRT